MTLLENTSIVLVDTLYGGNVGSVARIMANFGLSDLRLVRPAPGLFDDPALAPMARGAGQPILENARTFLTLAEALADCSVAWGFTTRLGKKRTDGQDLRPAIEGLACEMPGGRMAAVFGSEDAGLTTEDLEKCSLLVRIPTAPDLSSLNLAQAVALFSYEAHELGRKLKGPLPSKKNTATVEELEGLYAHLEEVLQLIGFIEEKSPARMMNVMRRMISRRMPDPRDVRIIRGVLSKVELAVERAKKGL